MKKLLILLLILIPCLSAFTMDLGFGVDVALFSDFGSAGASRASSFDMTLAPSVVMMLKPKVELRPYLLIGIDKQSDPDGIAGWLADWSQFSMGLGAGLYYHFIQKEVLDLSVGPRLDVQFGFKPTGTSAPVYTTYSNILLGIALPINLDVKLTKNLFLRTGVEILGLEFVNESGTVGGVKSGAGHFYFQDFLRGFNPYFGFYYML